MAVKEKSADGSTRRHPVAVHYDTIVRKTWEYRAYNNDPKFNIDKDVLQLNRDALDRARTIFHSYRPKGKGKGKSNQRSNWGHSEDSKGYKRPRSYGNEQS
jgi:hypothetical protein